MSDPTVLVVDDEPAIADAHAQWLSEEYTVKTAYDGEQALELMDDSIDVVLLDRRMPGISGDEVLETVRERGYDCRVAMVSAVEPSFDILELGYDTYLVKPVSEADRLLETVETLLRRSEYDDQMQELLALASKKGTLEAKKTRSELEDHAEYQQLKKQLDALYENVSDATEQLDDDDLRAEFFELKS
ncbi:response regulator [Natrononativus amylolyticus]|uniref:response regulator n=1 Tax=Natrononativus amylolyticus TaxID=2963434 RepID=UPI0020CBB2A1|nr:response regulator [Natrononativus amylolyticus]